MTRRVVTIRANSYEPDTRYPCEDWLTAHAVSWWFRKRGRYVTVQCDPGRVGRWWARCETRMANRFNRIGGTP